MYYTTNQVQNASADFENCLVIPSMLTDFVNTGTSVEATKGGKEAYCFHGDLYFDNDDYRCPDCNCRMHMLNELIERIEVHQAEKIDGKWEQRLTIHYNCVGTIFIPDVFPLPAPQVSVNTRKGVVVNYAPCQIAI